MSQVEKIIEKIAAGERLCAEDALALYHEGELLTLAELAHGKRLSLHPEPDVSFVVDRNINYTNICVSECRFCAFFKKPGEDGAYIIERAALKQKIEETLALGGNQILLQGGMHPDLAIDFYTDLLKYMKENFPVHIHGFSPPEIDFMAEKSNLTLGATIRSLMDAGLDSIPGGGAEILSDTVRTKISPKKCTADRWLEVMETAHREGLRTTATMMFGHLETAENIIEHLTRIRDLQDKTGGFTAFIPWTFQPGNTRIDVATASSVEYLRVLALSRIFLDNVDNIQASWVTQGDKIAQAALMFGANDIGSTMIEENVVAAAGVNHMLPKETLIRLIEGAGYTAVQRDCFYNTLKRYEPAH